MSKNPCASPSLLKIRNGVQHVPSAKILRPATRPNASAQRVQTVERARSAVPDVFCSGINKDDTSFSTLNARESCGQIVKNDKVTVPVMTPSPAFSGKKSTSTNQKDDFLELEDLSDEETLLEEESIKQINNANLTRHEYIRICSIVGETPIQCFARQINSESIKLSNSLLTAGDMKPLAVCLKNDIVIEDLDLSENNLGPLGIRYLSEAIQENVFITSLNLSKVNMGLEGFRNLMNALKKNSTVTSLNISGNNLDANFAKDLAVHIRSNDYIKDLNLSENQLDDKAAIIIAPAIAANLTLRRLNLRWNHIRLLGAFELAKAISDNIELQEVDLSWNGLSQDGSKAFGQFLPKNHSLRVLDISYTRICFQSLKHLLIGIQNNDGLTTLKIHGNPITTDGAIALLKTLESSQMSKIRDVDIKDVSVNEELLNTIEQLTEVKPVSVVHRQPISSGLKYIARRRELKSYDPLLLLFEYMKQENLRLIDLFRALDTDQDSQISKKELKEGFKNMGIDLTDDEVDMLANKLDVNDDNVIEFEEFKIARSKNARIHKLSQQPGGEMYREMVTDIKQMISATRKGRIKSATREREKREKEKHKLLTDKKQTANKKETVKAQSKPKKKFKEIAQSLSENSNQTLHEVDSNETSGDTIGETPAKFKLSHLLNVILFLGKIRRTDRKDSVTIMDD